MKPRLSARRRVLQHPLTALSIRQVLRALLPRRNDYVDDLQRFEALLPELAQHGIRTRGQLRALIKKHRRALLEEERRQLEPAQVRRHVMQHGAANVRDAVRRRYWFGYPGFVRNALKLESGPSGHHMAH